MLFCAILLFVGLAFGQSKVGLTVLVPTETCYAAGATLSFNITVANNGKANNNNDGSVSANYVWSSNPATTPVPSCPTAPTSVAAQSSTTVRESGLERVSVSDLRV